MQQAGVGLGREEMQMIFLALKELVETQEDMRCRLWGKILGREGSYIIAEAQSRQYDEKEEEEEEEPNFEKAAEEKERQTQVNKEKNVLISAPEIYD